MTNVTKNSVLLLLGSILTVVASLAAAACTHPSAPSDVVPISSTTTAGEDAKAPVPATVAAPTFSPQPGKYSNECPVVTMKPTTANSTIRYTTDGSTPTANSAKYSGPINVLNSTTFKARAFKDGMTASATTATYTVSKAMALEQLKSWLIVDWCYTNTAFSLQQLRHADPKGSLLADVLQWFFTTVTPYSTKNAIEREVDRYSSKSISEIDKRVAELQAKRKTTNLQKAYSGSWCAKF